MTSSFRAELYDDRARKPCTDQHRAVEVVQHCLSKHAGRTERAQLS